MSETDENECPEAAAAGGGAALARELRRVAAHPPPGVRLLLRDQLHDVVALLDGPAETPYCGGVFRVLVSLARYPARPPRCVFLTRVFHPNVDAAGAVCVSTLARDWRPALGLAHALLALRCLLIAPNADSALNAEAAALLQDNYPDYFARAKLYTDIHARPRQDEPEEGPSAKRERRAAPAPAAPPAPARDKRRILKRL